MDPFDKSAQNFCCPFKVMVISAKSKCVSSRNTTITHCRPIHVIVRKSHKAQTVTRHQEEKKEVKQPRVRKQPIIALYFESENELKFYNLEFWSLILVKMIAKPETPCNA